MSIPFPPNCPICGKEMQWSANAQKYLCGPNGSGCEGVLTKKKAEEIEDSFGETEQ